MPEPIALTTIFSIKNIIIYLVLINLISFFAMWLDKRKAQKGEWRTKEATLLILSLIGGSIGGIVGMYVFRHKTKKLRFSIGIPAMLLLQIALVIYLCIIK